MIVLSTEYGVATHGMPKFPPLQAKLPIGYLFPHLNWLSRVLDDSNNNASYVNFKTVDTNETDEMCTLLMIIIIIIIIQLNMQN